MTFITKLLLVLIIINIFFAAINIITGSIFSLFSIGAAVFVMFIYLIIKKGERK